MAIPVANPPLPMAFFADFLSALPEERRFCLPCLAQMCSVSEDAVRHELETLATQVEVSSLGRCWTCEQMGSTYRLRRPYSAAA